MLIFLARYAIDAKMLLCAVHIKKQSPPVRAGFAFL